MIRLRLYDEIDEKVVFFGVDKIDPYITYIDRYRRLGYGLSYPS